MAAVGRILLILVVVLVIAVGAGFFLLPNTASRTQTLDIERPADSVFARLASTPAGTQIAQGVTVTEIVSAEDNVVTANVAYAGGETGKVVYTVAPNGEAASRVRVRLEQNLGANPIARFTAIGGGPVSPLIGPASASVSEDLSKLREASFSGLQYSVVQVEPQPFFYIQNCSPTDAEAVKSVVTDSLIALRPIMARHNLRIAGPPIALEPRVETNEYCYRIGYPYTGTPPRVLAVGSAGTTPGGTALRVVYTGTEEEVWDQVYNPMDALLTAAYLDDPATNQDDWANYEVYHDDPTQPGGSRNREIFYVANGDISALTRILPPTAPAPVVQPAAEAAPGASPAPETPAAPEEPASATP
jgi:hypothetical protein